jgi:hypothetical protein
LRRKAGHTVSFVLEELLQRSERLLKQQKYYRNYLESTIGDKINALLSGCGSNIRKLIAAFFLSLKFLSRLQEKVLGYINNYSTIETPYLSNILVTDFFRVD